MKLQFNCYPKSFELAKVFRIARGEKTHANVLVLELTLSTGSNSTIGWAEAVPYGRYNESLDSVSDQVENFASSLAGLLANEGAKHTKLATQFSAIMPIESSGTSTLLDDDRASESSRLIKSLIEQHVPTIKAGSARNLIDCACWDLLAKLEQHSVSSLLEMPLPQRATSAQTLSIDGVAQMQQSAAELAHLPLLKVKLDKDDVVQKMQSIYTACPNSRFIVDANESWDIQTLKDSVAQLKQFNVVLIEQPLPADEDDPLLEFSSPITLCADESCHGSDQVEQLAKKYQALNIKLDKTGGLSEAISVLHQAKIHKMQVMLGCMVGSSLAMAPIYLLADQADYVDLDGPVLVAQDRANGFKFEHGVMLPRQKHLWGECQAIVER